MKRSLQLPHRQLRDSSADEDAAAAVAGVVSVTELVCVDVEVAVVAVVLVDGAGVVPLDAELSPEVVGGLSDMAESSVHERGGDGRDLIYTWAETLCSKVLLQWKFPQSLSDGGRLIRGKRERSRELGIISLIMVHQIQSRQCQGLAVLGKRFAAFCTSSIIGRRSEGSFW